jgi:hypothetical protein
MQHEELKYIKDLVRQSRPITIADVRTIVDGYFTATIWSILKDEWADRMTETERVALCDKLLQEVQ